MMFPKGSGKKKRKKHSPSIMQRRDHTCFLCRKLEGDWTRKPDLHEHHVFGGTANRTLSEQYGLKVWLCPEHHLTGPDAVHRNADVMAMLRREGQQAFEVAYPELDFMEIFGKNYV